MVASLTCIRPLQVSLPEIIQVANAVYNGPDLPPTRISADVSLNRTATTNSFGTIWEIVDAHTLNRVTYIANVSAGGTAVYSIDGSILRYNLVHYGNITNPNSRITIWNASAGTIPSSPDGTGYWQWRPAGGTFGGSNPYFSSTVRYNIVHDGALMYTGNFSIPNPYGPINGLLNQTGSISVIEEGKYGIITTAGRNDERGVVPAYVQAFSLVCRP